MFCFGRCGAAYESKSGEMFHVTVRNEMTRPTPSGVWPHPGGSTLKAEPAPFLTPERLPKPPRRETNSSHTRGFKHTTKHNQKRASAKNPSTFCTADKELFKAFVGWKHDDFRTPFLKQDLRGPGPAMAAPPTVFRLAFRHSAKEISTW